MSTRTTSRKNLRIVENEAWQTPFIKATRAVSRGPNSPAFTTASGYRGIMDTLRAVRAPVGHALMLRHDGRCVDDFHLLEHFGFVPRTDQRAAAVRAAVEGVGLEVVDHLRWERGPQVLFMPRLPALFRFAALGWRLLRLYDVARRRLGGGGGILAGGGQLLLQASVLRLQRRKTLPKHSHFRQGLASSSFIARENTHPGPPIKTICLPAEHKNSANFLGGD